MEVCRRPIWSRSQRLVGDTARATMLRPLMGGEQLTGNPSLRSWPRVSRRPPASTWPSSSTRGFCGDAQAALRLLRDRVPLVPQMLESLKASPPSKCAAASSTLGGGRRIRFGRTCYTTHAGTVGVAIADALSPAAMWS